MFNRFIRVTFAACLAGTSTHAMAQAVQWRVTEASGPVFVQHGTSRSEARPGTTLQVGETIVTGAKGTAVLVHNKDFVSVAANSRVRIPQEQGGSAFTRVFQEMGNAVFRIEKLGTPHFAVDTPYLAAVVKGTTFSITVSASDTSLQVTEGLVEVATSDRGASDLVRPGSIAMISGRDRYRLTISGDRARVVDSPARQGRVATVAPAGALLVQASAAPSANALVQAGADDRARSNEDSRSESSGGPSAAPMLDIAITSKSADMARATGGLVTGESPVLMAAMVTPASVRQVLKLTSSGSSAPAAIAAKTADVSASSLVKSDTAKDINAGKDGSEAKDVKSGSVDRLVKDDKLGRDNATNEANAGKNDTAASEPKLGKGGTTANDAKEDKSGAAAKEGQPVKGDAANKDAPVVKDAPAPKDAAVVKDAPGSKDDGAAKDTPGPKDAPAPKDAPVVKDAPAPKDAPVVKDAPAPKDTPVVKDAPAPKDTPVVKDAPAPKDTPVVKDAPAPKDTPVVKDAPAPKDTPVVKDAPAPKDTPVVKDAPAPKDTPVVKDAPAPKDAPVVKDAPAPKDAPVVKDVPAPKDGPELKEPSVVKDASKMKGL